MSDARDTEPPTLIETEVPRPPKLPAEAIEQAHDADAGYDPSSWEHVQLKALVDAFRESRLARAAFDPEAIIKRAVDGAKEHFADLVNDELRGVNSKLDKLAGRVDTLEETDKGVANRMGGLERELAGIKSDLGRYGEEIGKLTARVNELEALRGKLQNESTQQAPSTPG